MEEMTLNQVQARDNLVLDVDVWMKDPNDHSFSPKLILQEGSLLIQHDEHGILATHELAEDELDIVQRDMVAEMRVKFMVRGMHDVLTHKTPLPMDGPNAKKLAEPRWKTILPINT